MSMAPRRKSASEDPRQAKLLELPERAPGEKPIKQLQHPIWTENKAKLIERYLILFVQITKCGTYIDGFAGPQQPDKRDMWAAKLVLGIRLLRHFHLFELTKNKVKLLRRLKNDLPIRDKRGRKLNQTVAVYPGDFNLQIRPLLAKRSIPDREPVFCLLDQRTFECHWETVRLLAEYKKTGHHKFEQFYFFGIGWLKRSIFGIKKNHARLQNWWGRDDWRELKSWPRDKILNEMVCRFKQELGYKSVKPYPIYERQNVGNIMYYMIHATDHDEAPQLMTRAYNTAMKRKGKQLVMFQMEDQPEPHEHKRSTRPRRPR